MTFAKKQKHINKHTRWLDMGMHRLSTACISPLFFACKWRCCLLTWMVICHLNTVRCIWSNVPWRGWLVLSPVIQLADGSDFFICLLPHSAERCSPGLALKFKLHFNACWFTNWVEQNITWLSIVAELITDEVKRFYCI